MCPGQTIFITVDGTDFWIPEPKPFNPGYYSHKFRHAGLRYEIGICIATGWIVWVNGPYPCGNWPDLRIARHCLHGELCRDEMYIADGGYYDGYQYAFTPTGAHEYSDKQMALARARHETVNKCFKVFNCLKGGMFRHDRQCHYDMAHAIINIVQLGIMCGKLTFQIDYDQFDDGEIV
jgi:hypothetical protein